MPEVSISLTDIIALAASAAACLSAIAALVAVRQNHKQRVASYEPHLVLVDRILTLRAFPQLPKQAFCEEDEDEVTVQIVNLGLGAARDLTVNWKFPGKQMISSVNRTAQRLQSPVQCKYLHRFLMLEGKHSSSSVLMYPAESRVNFLLPVSVGEAFPVNLRIPMSYMTLVSGHYHFALRRDSGHVSDPPKLECCIQYDDINGRTRNLNLIISIEPFDISMDLFRCTLQSTRR